MPSDPTERDALFTQLRAELKKCCPPMIVVKDNDRAFEIAGNKAVPYGSKKKMIPGMHFSSVIIGEASVTFQFFPIYLQTQGYMDIIPTSLKCLKAKTCFNFKKGEQVNTKEISALLKKGIQTWKKLGYMK